MTFKRTYSEGSEILGQSEDDSGESALALDEEADDGDRDYGTQWCMECKKHKSKKFGFSNRQMFFYGVDDEDHVGQARHVFNAAKCPLQLIAATGALKQLARTGEIGALEIGEQPKFWSHASAA